MASRQRHQGICMVHILLIIGLVSNQGLLSSPCSNKLVWFESSDSCRVLSEGNTETSELPWHFHQSIQNVLFFNSFLKFSCGIQIHSMIVIKAVGLQTLWSIEAKASRQRHQGKVIKAKASRQRHQGKGITAKASRQRHQGKGIEAKALNKAMRQRQWDKGIKLSNEGKALR